MATHAGARIAGLDVVRGLAILLVMLQHAFPAVLDAAGVVGVELFFVLSGFLITGVLERDLSTRGRVRFGHFYWNRLFRLVPALLALLVVYACVVLLWDPLGDRGTLVKSLAVGMTYTSDLPGLDNINREVSHLWSLAVEEQFYLVWPVLLTVARTTRALLLTIAVMAGASLAVCLVRLAMAHGDASVVYKLPATWAVALLAGALAQRLTALRRTPALGPRGRAALTVPALVALLAASAIPGAVQSPWLYLAGVPALAILCAVVVVGAAHLKELRGVRPVFRGLAALGLISYGAYLWNYLLAQWIHVHDIATGLLSILLTLVLATASWFLIEKPAQRLKRSITRVRSEIPGSAPSEPSVN